MSDEPKAYLPLSDPDNNPIAVCVDYNEAMERWDVSLIVGNLKTKELAMKLADWLREFAEDELGGDMHRFQ